MARQQGALAALAVIAARQAAAQQVDGPGIFRLWPEHVPALQLWQSVETQLRWDDGQPTGLDYWGVRCSPAFRKLPRDQRESIFEDVCTMERAWIAAKLKKLAADRARIAQRA